ncbi:hypothetical protein A2V49_00585 [candidate division WWE3 bacterium RBG_19FT_COMBO_34_6]|uniref:Uncharacterized protein n=1 Tax=candidate division WWE3 bacterium RBG_19FT_COMBO_34_6 TaxID=1802612 RepID=A0A1F4UP21_UNCKA|nr:MAG: hypothetical protein A2V49_00585 [candidate division WWE3 bacterium RBG_19FT_COMBO_34_6]
MLCYEDAKIKADGYDQTVEVQEDFKDKLNDLKYEYNELTKGKFPSGPFVQDTGDEQNKQSE